MRYSSHAECPPQVVHVNSLLWHNPQTSIAAAIDHLPQGFVRYDAALGRFCGLRRIAIRSMDQVAAGSTKLLR
jgi:hypothetical protein